MSKKYEWHYLTMDNDYQISLKLVNPPTKIKGYFVFIHGYFSANSLGPNRLFVDIQERLLQRGIVSIRYDWKGMGDSTGNICENTLKSTVEEIIKTLKFSNIENSNNDVYFVAHSLGCAVLLEYLNSYFSVNPKCVFLISPGPFSEEGVKKLCPSFSYDSEYLFRNGLKIGLQFLKDVINSEFYEKVEKLKFPLRAFVSEDDNLLDINSLHEINNTNLEITTLLKGGHNFIDYNSKLIVVDKIIQTIDVS